MSLVAITSYYNPLDGIHRRMNYKTFRRHLGIPLITVEWSQSGHFELGDQDADYLVQVTGGDLLWQKERLLNLGIDKARSIGADKVAVLDSDVVFHNPHWHQVVAQTLETHDFIQCFDSVHYLPFFDYQHLSHADLCNLSPEHTTQSLFDRINKGETLWHGGAQGLQNVALNNIRGNPGLATSIHLKRLAQWRFYEGNIVGGGDLAMAASLSGKTKELFETLVYTDSHQRHLLKWAQSQNPSRIRLGHANGRILHLWHGEIQDRQYRQRYSVLTRHNYNPDTDLTSHESGALGFSTFNPHLKTAVGNYIHSRKDG